MLMSQSVAEAVCYRSGQSRRFDGLFEAVRWSREQARRMAMLAGFQALSEDSHSMGLTVVGENRDAQGRLVDLEILLDLRLR